MARVGSIDQQTVVDSIDQQTVVDIVYSKLNAVSICSSGSTDYKRKQSFKRKRGQNKERCKSNSVNWVLVNVEAIRENILADE